MRYHILGLALSFLAATAGCGVDSDAASNLAERAIRGRPERIVEPELRPALEEYLRRAPNRGRFRDLAALRFGDPGEAISGTCIVDVGLGFSRYEVVIRPRPPGPTRDAIVFHELGHCLHAVGHSPDPESLMYETVVEDDEYWSLHLANKLAEVFRE